MRVFLTHLSAQDSVLDLVSDIEFDRHTLSVFLDVDKGSNSVCFALLLEGLGDLGLRGCITQYLKTCLSQS